MRREIEHKDILEIVKTVAACYRIVLAFTLLIVCSSMLFAQDHKLVIGDGASFSGNGIVTVKDSIRNSNTSASTSITGKVILSGATQVIVNNGTNSSLNIETLSVRGSGEKTVVGTMTVTDSLNILSGTNFNISNDTLRVGNIIANSGTITPSANTVIEYNNNNNGSTQSILGGTFQCKIRLIGNSRKDLLGILTVDSLEHSGWGLTVNNNLNVNGEMQIDSLINVTNGISLSLGANNGIIATLQGNDGIIQTNSTGMLTFINPATNGNGTIRTDNSTITFNGNVNGAGTLAVTGTGTMVFGGTVASTNYSFAQGSTEIYNGSTQTIINTNYGNLTLSNPGTKTFAAGTTGIGGTITIGSGATADAITNLTTVDYNGTGAQTIGALDYYNLNFSNNHGNQQMTLVNGDTIRVAGTFTNSATNVTFANTDNTFAYNGSSPQIITPFTYYNLVLSGSGAKTVNASQTTNGDVVQQAGTKLTVDGSVVWQIDGSIYTGLDFVNNGDVTIGN
jgi:hypothetical protein